LIASGRSLAHVVTAVRELHELGVAFVSLKEGLDLSTAAGRLQLHILSALGEFECSRLIERTKAGLARARRQGKTLGRPPRTLSQRELQRTATLSVREAARMLRNVTSHDHSRSARVTENGGRIGGPSPRHSFGNR
jgi:DNA invertase Pin-like site-specific DNA recombinase